MTATFFNSYADTTRAQAYSQIEFTNTYYLAYRDLPEIIRRHVRSTNAIDFGCGAGRSTRFLQQLGFNVTGIDISADMINRAHQMDPEGHYLHINDGDFSAIPLHSCNLVQSIFTFDNIPDANHRANLMRGLGNLLARNGCLLLLDSTPELYLHDWASFTTTCFPTNRTAKSGDLVHTIITDAFDSRPVDDILWLPEDYRQCFEKAGLSLVASYKPLAKAEEPFPWVNETTIAPWVIYVLKNTEQI